MSTEGLVLDRGRAGLALPDGNAVVVPARRRRRLLYDPEDMGSYPSKHVDVPPNQWPGEPQGAEAVKWASNHPKDWFRVGMRIEENRIAWARFAHQFKRRGPFDPNFTFDEVLVIGPYGEGKSALLSYVGRYWNDRGHPVFSNISLLFGMRITSADLHTILGRLPRESCLILDEASTEFEAGYQNTATAFFQSNLLNLRKLNIKVLFATAQDYNLHPKTLQEIRRVWRPVKAKVDVPFRGRQCDNPNNFHMVYLEWGDWPYRRANKIEGGERASRTKDARPKIRHDQGNNVRSALLSMDTFELARAGDVRLQDSVQQKEKQRRLRDRAEGRISNGSAAEDRSELEAQLGGMLHLLEEMEAFDPEDRPGFLAPGEVAAAMGLQDSAAAGRLIQRHLSHPTTPVRNVQRYGYPVEAMLEAKARLEEEGLDS